MAPVMLHQPSEWNNYCFSSSFQILHKFLLWLILNQNHIGKEILKIIILSWYSWLSVKPQQLWYFHAINLETQVSEYIIYGTQSGLEHKEPHRHWSQITMCLLVLMLLEGVIVYLCSLYKTRISWTCSLS